MSSSTFHNESSTTNGTTNSIFDHHYFDPSNGERGLNEDPDILDEFLDQRVYDSIGTNTPISGSQIKLERPDLLDSLFPSMDATDINTNTNNNNNSNNNELGSSDLSNNTSTNHTNNANNDYLYLDVLNFPNNNNTTNNSSMYTSPSDHKDIKNDSPDSNYDYARDELSKLKFGNYSMKFCPDTIDVRDASYLDFSSEALSKLSYNLQVSNLPNYSRVETQIKLKLSLSPPPPQVLLHIPQDLISKNKFCLNEDINNLSPKLKESLLFLDAYVLTSDLSKSCNICSRCIKREQKRASRRKAGFELNGNETTYSTPTPISSGSVVKNNPNSWNDDQMMKKGIIFNCKEIVSFPPPTGLNNDSSKSLELSARIICYCRHHKESEGFKLLFVIRNSEGIVVGKQLSSPIMIMDRKKNTASVRNDNSVPNSVAGSSTNLQSLNSSFGNESNNRSEFKKKKSNSDSDMDLENDGDDKSPLHPLSPNSIDESASEIQTNTDTDGRSLKRKKLSIDDSFNSSTNPMFNGSTHGYSPLSNSDTNTSTTNHNMLSKPNGMLLNAPLFSTGVSPLSHSNSQSLRGASSDMLNYPFIQRIIPAQGPIRGGIEVTLLGRNFRTGLQVKFGANQALATHCWSDTTIVTYLPAAAQPGQVLVSFENHDTVALNSAQQQQQIFTYTDDTDRQLIELALQIVGLKMNGKLEDARNIAKRIVGSDSTANKSPVANGSTNSGNSTNTVNNTNDWFDSAHKAAQELSNPNLSTEVILINFLSLVDLPNCPIIIPNWQLCNKLGQSLLHLATLKNYGQLIKFLITHGCKIDLQDNQGLTPLFFASLCGHRDLINIFLDCKSNWNLKLSNDKYLKDYCDLNVLDIFNSLEEQVHSGNEDFEDVLKSLEDESKDDKLNKSVSLDSLNSMFAMNYGRHISKMVMQEGSLEQGGSTSSFKAFENSNRRETLDNVNTGISDTNSEFADSEYESDDYEDYSYEEDDDYDEDEEYMDDYEGDEEEEIEPEIEPELIESSSTVPTSTSPEEEEEPLSQGLWQKVKNVFNSEGEEDNLPAYDDLFPFGPSTGGAKPKTDIELSLNDSGTSHSNVEQCEDAGVSSDSSEDMVLSYINHPRKNVENDKMLIFFWIPALIVICSVFFMVSVMGYRFEFIESIKSIIRSTLGNIMVGNERIGRVFKAEIGNVLAERQRGRN
ncbi:SPT3 dosage dependent suppressor of Ty-induced promoter mutations-like protein [Scheffersomyces amazonensis]|uniref:SPT3 dosage dependent suppressor of Ty-induced promoter mutations-like protein n=1 Tax=Scheffersomyces amazonensis TaxID=1078765 RepID=UPI00315D5964